MSRRTISPPGRVGLSWYRSVGSRPRLTANRQGSGSAASYRLRQECNGSGDHAESDDCPVVLSRGARGTTRAGTVGGVRGACSIQHGRLAGLASVLGLEIDALLHVAGAALGLGTLLASSHQLFQLVRYAGAAYLVLLGVRQLRRRPVEDGVPKHRAVSSSWWRLVRERILVDLPNPKTALLFLAFLPQFVHPAEGSEPVQILVLGGCFVVLAAGCDAGYALAAGGPGAGFARRPAETPADHGWDLPRPRRADRLHLMARRP